MGDPLLDMYGIGDDAPPVQKAAVRRAGKAAEALRRRQQSHSTEPPLSQANQSALAASGGVLFQAQADADARAAQEAEIAARHEAAAVPGPAGPGAELALQAQAQREGAYGLMGQVAAGHRTARSDNAMHEPTRQYIETSRELAMERPDIVEQQHRTRAQMARDAAVFADEAHAAESRISLRRDFLAEQQARKRAEVDENIGKYQQAIDKASADFQRVDKFDPNRAWADRSAGQKIRIALAALGRGLQGGNPQEVFNDVLQRELAAHRQTRSDAGEKMKAARDGMSNALVQRDSFLALAEDERVADAMVEAATLRKIQSKMAAMEAEYGPQVVTDQFIEARNTAEQMLADTSLKLAELEANNPKYRYRAYNVIPKEVRDLMKEDARMQLEGAGEAAKQYSGMQRDAAKAAISGRDQATERAETHSWEQRKFLAKETTNLRERIEARGQFMAKYGDDIPGKSALSWVPGVDAASRLFSKDARQARRLLKRDMMKRLRDESGAATPDYEIEREAEDILDGMTEDDVMAELNNRQEEDKRKLDLITRAVEEGAEAEYLARPVGPRQALTRGGGQGPASLVLDE
jgi:hypothetical protein